MRCATINDVMTHWIPLWGDEDPSDHGFGVDYIRARLRISGTSYEEITPEWLGDAYDNCMAALAMKETV